MTIREDPPPTARGVGERKRPPSVWFEALAGALAEPGVWHRLAGEWHPSQFSRLTRAAETRDPKLPRLPPGRWEFRFDDIPRTLRVHIWARVLPEEEAP